MAKRRPRTQLRKNRDRGRPGGGRLRDRQLERARGRKLLEDDDHASGERVLPPGTREKSEQARSRFEPRKGPASGARKLAAGEVAAFHGLIAEVRPSALGAGGDTVRCTVRGRLETADSEDRTLLVVGDIVEFSRPEAAGGECVVERLLPRSNVIVRGDRRVQRFRHVVAANVDGVLLVTSVLEPRFRPGMVDRFLVAASSQEVPASLVINKMDLLDEPGNAKAGLQACGRTHGQAAERRAEIERFRALYEGLGVPVVLTSATRREGLEALLEFMSGKRLALVGHSGVGKSTLLNALAPGLDLTVRPVNRKTGKGTHTTTVARLLELAGGVRVIDTPGIRELGIVEVASVDLEVHFTEFLPLLENCEKDNCTHRTEPGCAVAAAVESGEVHRRRYESYLTIRKELEKRERPY